MDSTLRLSDKSHITFADTGKSKVLGLGTVAISKDQHMDKVMLVESLGFNLMSVSMLCDLNMIVIFGKYRCLVLMESDKSLVFEGYRKDDLYMVDFSDSISTRQRYFPNSTIMFKSQSIETDIKLNPRDSTSITLSMC